MTSAHRAGEVIVHASSWVSWRTLCRCLRFHLHRQGSIPTRLHTVLHAKFTTAFAHGDIYGFGDATFFGDLAGTHLNAPIVGMAPTLHGGGYWLVAADGGVFSFGGAPFAGSMGGTHLNAPVTAIAASSLSPNDYPGYDLVVRDGGIFSFGAALFDGSTGDLTLAAPVVAIVSV